MYAFILITTFNWRSGNAFDQWAKWARFDYWRGQEVIFGNALTRILSGQKFPPGPLISHSIDPVIQILIGVRILHKAVGPQCFIGDSRLNSHNILFILSTFKILYKNWVLLKVIPNQHFLHDFVEYFFFLTVAFSGYASL